MAVWYVKTGNGNGTWKKGVKVGDQWENFLTHRLMALDWSTDGGLEIGDLRSYPDKTALEKAAKEVFPGQADQCARELWRLKAEVKDGDIVVAVRGQQDICGYGVVIGGYQYCKEDNDFRHTRKVRWTEKLEHFDENVFARNGSLFELKEPMREKVEKLLAINFEEIMKNSEASVIKEKIRNLLVKNKNIILQGPPGTGKTHLAREIAREFVSDKSISEYEKLPKTEKEKIEKEQIGFVQFHPSYDYTDFVEGLRPAMVSNMSNMSNTVGFELRSGIFKNFIGKAKDAYKEAKEKSKEPKKYVFIIDEINRGDISKIFGELFFSIDPGYRGEEGSVTLQYKSLHENGDEKFYIPENVYIIGTMNNIDRSVDTFDFAMRRRFCFIEVSAKESQAMLSEINDEKREKIKKRMDGLNDKIKKGLGENYEIGAAYFLKLNSESNSESESFDSLWEYYLRPLLQEYVRGLPNEEGLIKDFKEAYNKSNAGVKPTEDEHIEGEQPK